MTGKLPLLCSLCCILTLAPLSHTLWSQEKPADSAKQLQELAAQVNRLQAEISKLKEQLQKSAAGDSSAAAVSAQDVALERELAAELGQSGGVAATDQAQIKPPPASAARKKLFQSMNPNVSVIGTMLGGVTGFDDTQRNVNLDFEESEFSFQAAVDPYAKADFFLALGKEVDEPLVPAADAAAEEEEAGFNTEIEEAFITLLNMPLSTRLKAGKFRGKFGKINETHPHAYNFVNLPLMYTNFFGAEGLNDEGVSLDWLVPNSSFFQELTVQVTSGPGENSSFTRAEDNHLLYLAHLKNLFDVNENTTLELGVTGLTGPNGSNGDNTKILAADLTLKWKPLRFNRYKSFEWLSEVLVSNRESLSRDVTSFGLYSFLRYQVAKRWFVGAMYDYSEFPDFSDFHRQAFSGIAQFFATEFQKVEVQYRYNEGDFFDNFSDVRVRAVFVIGAHGAHQY